jgi:nucleoside-diphosphate-sugar epimerase
MPVGLPASVEWQCFDATSHEVRIPPGTDAIFYLSQSPHYRHFSGYAHHVLAVNVVGAVRAAIAGERAGVRFFCYASSGNVYAPSFKPLREDMPLRRDSGYAYSKVVAEESLHLLHTEMTTTSVRIFGLFGPGQAEMFLPKLISRIGHCEAVSLQPTPHEEPPIEGLHISLCFVADAVWCLQQLMERACGGQRMPAVVNLAGPESVSIRCLANEIARLQGTRAVFTTLSTPRDFDLRADVTQLRELLQPSFTPLSAALAQTLGASASALSLQPTGCG